MPQADEFSAAEKAVATLAAVFPNPPVARPTLREYAKRLSGIDPRQLAAAVEVLIENARFFPSLAEIKATITRLIPDGRPDPELAWGEVLVQIRAVGSNWGVPNGGPKFSTPLIREALEAVASWSSLCGAEHLEAHRSRFVDAYRVLLERARFEEALPPLARKLIAEVKGGQTKQIGTSGESR